jgi:tripartite-type tricarboxylate transporter receptor subunit TctC
LFTLGTFTLLVAACAPAAPSPTAAPPKPAEAPKPAATAAPAKPTEAPAAKPAEAKPAASPVAKAEAKPAASPAAKPAEAKPAASPAAKPALSKAEGASFDEKAVADFFRGKTVKILVGHGAGGGFDVYARTIARHWVKHIPGTPTMIVENQAAAGGLVAANQVFNTQPKDGTVIGHVIGGIVRSQLLGTPGVEFDAAKFQYLGGPIGENSILIVTKASGVSSFERLLDKNAKTVTLGDGGIATTNHNASQLTKNVLGANINVVTGYGTVAKVELAMEQGEVDGQYNDWASSKARTLDKLTSGEWLIIGQLTDQPLQGLPQPNVPLILNFAKDDEQKQLLRFGIIVPNQFTRPFFMAPGVPADRVAALEQAFARTMQDKEFLADAEKGKLDIDPLTGAQLQKLITDYLGISADLKSKLTKVLPQT